MLFFHRRHNCSCLPHQAAPSCTSTLLRILVLVVGKIEVDHVLHKLQVQAPAKRCSRNQNITVALCKKHQVLPTFVGDELAVHARGGDGHGDEVFAEEIGAFARVDEDDCAAFRVTRLLLAAQHVFQELQLVFVAVSKEKILLDVVRDFANATDVKLNCKNKIKCRIN